MVGSDVRAMVLVKFGAEDVQMLVCTLVLLIHQLYTKSIGLLTTIGPHVIFIVCCS